MKATALPQPRARLEDRLRGRMVIAGNASQLMERPRFNGQ